MILSPCVVAIDMIGWQCYRYGVPGCTQVPGQLDFLATLTAPRRLAVTSLVPMLLVGLLWVLSRKTLIRYEETPTPKAAPLPSGTTPPDPGRRPILLRPRPVVEQGPHPETAAAAPGRRSRDGRARSRTCTS